MATIVTSLAATRSGILASARSSRAPARPSPPARNTPLPRDPNGSHARLRWRACKAPLDCRRATTRPVSSYALFQWWLLLSQHPGCLGRRTSFPTQHALRDLSRRSGLFPSRRRSLAPAVSLPRRGRPAFAVWLGVVSSRPRTQPAPYLRPPPFPRPCRGPARLHRYAFRGEPAISWFDWHFTPTHRSSPCFATHVGPGLHGALPPLHPAHG